MIQQIKNIKEKVKKLLTDVPRLRDSDEKLISTIWYQQIGKDKVLNFTALEFLTEFYQGKYVSPESIRRCRQKIQEQNPLLRGKSYKKRKNEASIIKQQIHAL